MSYCIKVVTGFRDDQRHTIPMREAHKAYYLFKNPDARGIFDNGVALIGKNIQEIIPDWNGTMGWYDSHKLDSADYEELRKLGVDAKMYSLIEKAKKAGDMLLKNPTLLSKDLDDVLQIMGEEKKQIGSNATKQLLEKFRIN